MAGLIFMGLINYGILTFIRFLMYVICTYIVGVKLDLAMFEIIAGIIAAPIALGVDMGLYRWSKRV